MTDTPRVEPRPTFGPFDVVTPDEVRAAIGPVSDNTWAGIKARVPWSNQLGPRLLCIQWQRFLDWLAESERRVA